MCLFGGNSPRSIQIIWPKHVVRQRSPLSNLIFPRRSLRFGKVT